MSLSLTAGPRHIYPGYEFDKFFPQEPSLSHTVISRNGTVEDAVRAMAEISSKFKQDTALISTYLQGKTVDETAQNIWQFIYNYIQYEEDKPGIEQIRRPSRTWADRQSGVDCDCMSVFASSILKNLDIPHYFRITRYDKPDFQHVYVIIPYKSVSGTNNKYITIDGVIDTFNFEKQFSENKDFNSMNGIPIHLLNGIGQIDQSSYANDQLLDYLVTSRKLIETSPELLQDKICPCDALPMFNYIINQWPDPHDRYLAIEKVATFEQENFPHLKFFQTLKRYMDGQSKPGHVKLESYLVTQLGENLPFEQNGEGYGTYTTNSIEYSSGSQWQGPINDPTSSSNPGSTSSSSNWWDEFGSGIANFGADLFKTYLSYDIAKNQNVNLNPGKTTPSGNNQNPGNVVVIPGGGSSSTQSNNTVIILAGIAVFGIALYAFSRNNKKTSKK